jgi:hypothetical protein
MKMYLEKNQIKPNVVDPVTGAQKLPKKGERNVK